jgi:trehalose 6-phosphate synthase/phosphatase
MARKVQSKRFATSPEDGRLLLVSNRLPVTVSFNNGEMALTPSGGGLATGLRGVSQRMGSVWVGWPGEMPTGSKHRAELEHRLSRYGSQPVYLSRAEQKGFYEDFSNAAIWPVFHDLIDQLPLTIEGWPTYRYVNQKFADAVAAAYRPGDIIWVNDYHLMTAPQLIREIIPDARLGFFLHIPFPSPEIFGVLPARADLLKGLLGADLIGFHTRQFADSFIASVESVLGARTTQQSIRYGGRNVRVGVFPMGIDAAAWEERARSTPVAKQVLALMQDAGKRKIILGIDRLDYTKGLLRRIAAIEKLLQSDRRLADRVRFVQVSFPSRERIESYAGLRRQLNETVGRINATYGSPRSLPVHLVQRSFPEDEVSALYSAADIMLVTPLRDGMNLVAKEFVASRLHGDGVLVLSEFAGAAAELKEALIVNPYDTEGMATAIKSAIEMPRDQQRARMSAMRRTVTECDVQFWAQSFLGALAGEGK